MATHANCLKVGTFNTKLIIFELFFNHFSILYSDIKPPRKKVNSQLFYRLLVGKCICMFMNFSEMNKIGCLY